MKPSFMKIIFGKVCMLPKSLYLNYFFAAKRIFVKAAVPASTESVDSWSR